MNGSHFVCFRSDWENTWADIAQTHLTSLPARSPQRRRCCNFWQFLKIWSKVSLEVLMIWWPKTTKRNSKGVPCIKIIEDSKMLWSWILQKVQNQLLVRLSIQRIVDCLYDVLRLGKMVLLCLLCWQGPGIDLHRIWKHAAFAKKIFCAHGFCIISQFLLPPCDAISWVCCRQDTLNIWGSGSSWPKLLKLMAGGNTCELKPTKKTTANTNRNLCWDLVDGILTSQQENLFQRVMTNRICQGLKHSQCLQCWNRLKHQHKGHEIFCWWKKSCTSWGW